MTDKGVDTRAENKSYRLRIVNQRKGKFALPDFLQDVADVVGIETALEIGKAKGGRQVYFRGTRNITDDYWLVQLIGAEKAKKLTATLFCSEGAHVDVPRGPTSPQAVRWLKMRELILNGWSSHKIADQLGVHHRTVRRMRSDLRGAGYTVPTAMSETFQPDHRLTRDNFALHRPTAAAAFEAGASPDEVAARCGVILGTARKWQAIWRGDVNDISDGGCATAQDD